MEKLQITKDAALTAYQNGTKNDKVLLENLLGKKNFLLNIMDRVKSFDDILAEAGILKSDFELQHANLSPDTYAYEQIKLIVQVLNEGWSPDWTNGKWDKYFPWFNMDASGSGFSYGDYGRWITDSSVGSRLCFKSSELAKFAGTTFIEIYKSYMV